MKQWFLYENWGAGVEKAHEFIGCPTDNSILSIIQININYRLIYLLKAFIQSSKNQTHILSPGIRETIRTDNLRYLVGSFVEDIHFNINCRTACLVL